MSSQIQPRIYSGTRDFLPQVMLRREAVLAAMRRAFQLYGFAPLETPTMEYLEILMGKYGDDEQLIYKLDYRNDDPKKRLALRYDLTVPLARTVAMHPDLPMPFKRYQMQPVWRADRPQPHQGRFREFYQCDIDALGSKSLSADAEIITACAEVMQELGLPGFEIRINHRKMLSGLVALAGLKAEQESSVLVAIDKLDKIGLEGVRKEFEKRQIDATKAEKLVEMMQLENAGLDLAQLQSLATQSESLELALGELDELFNHLRLAGLQESHYKMDLSLARGLSYYTGPIFETKVPELPHMGSVMGGGRYDGLVELFSGRDVPAVGATLGLDRLLAALEQLDGTKGPSTPAKVLVTRFFDETDEASILLAARLRKAGIPTELAYEKSKLKKQFQLAHRKGIPFVITLGPDEWEAGEVGLKTMATGEQTRLTPEELMHKLKTSEGA
jgi:histidyl-tRNA synthetase